ncbi:glycosyltransferase [Halomonas sp. NCCP-2165]|nr:glycosyltransferase [Halomonas sp. NCCP-2165]GKW49738.1 hypothetical protein NCCP2165_19530 [Halomonas sp. NCCP-2165]
MNNSAKHQSPKRILMVLRRLGMGGIEKATVVLANAMVREGHEVHLLIFKGQPELELDPRVRVHCRNLERESRKTPLGLAYYILSRTLLRFVVPGSSSVWPGFVVSRRFKDFLHQLEAADGRFDLILIRGQGAFELLWNFYDSRCWQMVEAVTGVYENRERESRWLTRKLFEGKRVICVSQGIADGLRHHLEDYGVMLADLRVIYNAVPIDDIRRLGNETPVPAFDRPYLVHVARLVPEKGQRVLIEAYYLARQQGVTAPLVIIGDGSERGRLEAQAERLGLRDHVHFLGQQSNPYPWVARASAFVLSSHFEGLGLVLIEALALGTQCVATDVPGGIREVLSGKQRRLVAEHGPASLAEKIREALVEPVAIDASFVERFEECTILPQFLLLIDEAESPLSDQT